MALQHRTPAQKRKLSLKRLGVASLVVLFAGTGLGLTMHDKAVSLKDSAADLFKSASSRVTQLVHRNETNEPTELQQAIQDAAGRHARKDQQYQQRENALNSVFLIPLESKTEEGMHKEALEKVAQYIEKDATKAERKESTAVLSTDNKVVTVSAQKPLEGQDGSVGGYKDGKIIGKISNGNLAVLNWQSTPILKRVAKAAGLNR